MYDTSEKSQRNSIDRTTSTATWIMGTVFLAALLGVLFFYDGRAGSTSSSGANPPNVVTGTQSSK